MAFSFDLFDLLSLVCHLWTIAKRITILRRQISARWPKSGQIYVISTEFWGPNRRRLSAPRETSLVASSEERRLYSQDIFRFLISYVLSCIIYGWYWPKCVIKNPWNSTFSFVILYIYLVINYYTLNVDISCCMVYSLLYKSFLGNIFSWTCVLCC